MTAEGVKQCGHIATGDIYEVDFITSHEVGASGNGMTWTGPWEQFCKQFEEEAL